MMKILLNKTLLVLLTAAIILAAGCTKTLDQTPQPDMVTVTVSGSVVSRSPGTPAEDAIATLRLIIFNTQGSVVYNKVNNGQIPFVISIRPGNVRMIMVANELTTWDLTNIVSSQDLLSKTMDANAPSSFPMYADMTYNIANYTQEFVMSLERTHVKVTLNLSCDYNTCGVKFTLYSFGIKSVPYQFYLVPQENSTTLFPNLPNVLVSDNIIYSPNGFTSKAGGIIYYIPERIINNKNNYSYVSIMTNPMPVTGSRLTFDIILGNGANKLLGANPVPFANLLPSDLTLTRNTHYIITAVISNKILTKSSVVSDNVKNIELNVHTDIQSWVADQP